MGRSNLRNNQVSKTKRSKNSKGSNDNDNVDVFTQRRVVVKKPNQFETRSNSLNEEGEQKETTIEIHQEDVSLIDENCTEVDNSILNDDVVVGVDANEDDFLDSDDETCAENIQGEEADEVSLSQN